MDSQALAKQFGGTTLGSAPAATDNTFAAPVQGSAQIAQTLGGTALGSDGKQPEKKNEDGFLKSMAKDVVKTLITTPVTRTAQVAAMGAEPFVSPENKQKLQTFESSDQTVNYPLIGDVTVPAPQTSGEGVAKEVVGQGLKVASYLYAPAKIAEGTGLLYHMLQGGKVGGISGAAYGGGEALQEQQSVGDAATQAAEYGAGAGAISAVSPLALLGLGKLAKLPVDLAKGVASYGNREALTNKLGETYNTILNLTPKQEIIQGRTGKDAGLHMATLQGEGHTLPLSTSEGNLNTVKAQNYLTENLVKPENELSDKLVASENKQVALTDLKRQFTNAVTDNTGSLGFSGTDLIKAESKANQEFNAYMAQYKSKILTKPDGSKYIPLEDINQMRKDLWARSKVAFGSTNTDKLFANLNFRLGHAARNVVLDYSENTLTKDLLERLGDHQNLMKMLSARNGKPIGQSLPRQLASKVLGSMIGNYLEPHGGGIIGYFVGPRLERLIDNPNIDTALLRNLLINKGEKDPEIIKQVETLLANRDKAKANMLALPSPSYIPANAPTAKVEDRAGDIFNNDIVQNSRIDRNTLRLPAPSFTPMGSETVPAIPVNPSFEMQVLDASKGRVGMNKETGKFQSTFTSGGEPTKTKSKSNENPLIQRQKDIHPKGMIDPNVAIAAGAAATVLPVAAAASKVPALQGHDTYQSDKPDKPSIEVPKLLDAIRNNETRGEKDPYNFSRSSGSTTQGKALGAYQVTEGELKTYADRFLGHDVTPKEFLSSPELQDSYMENKIKWMSEVKKLSIEEIIAAHRGGFGDLTKAGEKVEEYGKYVKAAMDQYNLKAK